MYKNLKMICINKQFCQPTNKLNYQFPLTTFPLIDIYYPGP